MKRTTLFLSQPKTKPALAYAMMDISIKKSTNAQSAIAFVKTAYLRNFALNVLKNELVHRPATALMEPMNKPRNLYILVEDVKIIAQPALQI
jgi:hypothetical protein